MYWLSTFLGLMLGSPTWRSKSLFLVLVAQSLLELAGASYIGAGAPGVGVDASSWHCCLSSHKFVMLSGPAQLTDSEYLDIWGTLDA